MGDWSGSSNTSGCDPGVGKRERERREEKSMARLRKSGRNGMLFGVAGGLAEYFRMDPVIIRALFILMAFASGIGVFVYVVLALIMARPEGPEAEPLEIVKDNLRSAPRETTEAVRRGVRVLRGPAGPAGPLDVNGPSAPQSEEGA